MTDSIEAPWSSSTSTDCYAGDQRVVDEVHAYDSARRASTCLKDPERHSA